MPVTSRMRLVDLLAGLSAAGDHAMGLEAGESMRACVIATSLARRLDLGEEEVGHVLYTTLLLHLGCTAYAHERTASFGDEIAINAASARTNFLDVRDVFRQMLPAATSGLSGFERTRAAAYLIVRGNDFGKKATTATCEVGRRLAQRLSLPDPVPRALYESFEYWNGKGDPHGLEGEEISLPARIAPVASVACVFAGIGGSELAIEAVRTRSGAMLDPQVCERFISDAHELIDELESSDPREMIREREPQPIAHRDRAGLVEIATAFADLADLKMPFTHGHSREVARLAVATAEQLRLGREAASELELAGLLHDLGRVAVSSSIWEKQGPLTSAEWEQVRLHAYHSERILAGAGALEPLATLAGTHHERLDGSGYHRGCKARELPPPARVLAAADAYQAMTQDRPHRPSLGAERAASELEHEARAGRLDPEVVAALLEAAGQRRRGRRSQIRPAELTDREIEVLRELAAGCSNREIAERLVISRRTAEHHVQHIYAKIGASSRAAAAVFALEHDLLSAD